MGAFTTMFPQFCATYKTAEARFFMLRALSDLAIDRLFKRRGSTIADPDKVEPPSVIRRLGEPSGR